MPLWIILKLCKGIKPSHYPNVKSLIYGVPENASFDSLKDCRKKFIVTVLNLFADVKGRINLLQISRFSGQCEQHFSIAVFCRENEAEICRKMYFSTDLTQNGEQQVSYYRSRFQVELLYG